MSALIIPKVAVADDGLSCFSPSAPLNLSASDAEGSLSVERTY
ncbi:MAG: hypothetical protein AB7V36_02140 [Bacteroidales bacterium]